MEINKLREGIFCRACSKITTPNLLISIIADALMLVPTSGKPYIICSYETGQSYTALSILHHKISCFSSHKRVFNSCSKSTIILSYR